MKRWREKRPSLTSLSYLEEKRDKKKRIDSHKKEGDERDATVPHFLSLLNVKKSDEVGVWET